MARKASKALEDQGYSKLEAHCIALNEYYKALRKAGFSEGLALFMITDVAQCSRHLALSIPDPLTL